MDEKFKSEFDRHRNALVELGIDPDDAVREVLKDMGLSASEDSAIYMEEEDV